MIAIAIGATLATACGRSDATPSGDGGAAAATTFTVTASGISPKSLTVPRGTQVTFVNGDSRPHDMSSDPHPTHETCPEINSVGLLASGQRRETANLNTARTCGFHDHHAPANASLQGTIVIQ